MRNGIAFTAHELCEIIEICGKSGVTRFSHNKTLIDFSGFGVPKPLTMTDMRVKADIAEQNKAVSVDVANNFEDRMTELMIRDPAAYEDALMSMENDAPNG